MSYGNGLGLEFSASASAGCTGSGCTVFVGSGSGKKPGKCDGGNWWRCAELVTYFQEPSGAGYSRRHVIVSGSLYQIKVEVINALLAMHMLSHTYGWANVKGQIRAMAWYLNYQRNWDFEDCIDALESAVAPAYDKYAQDEDKKLAAAATATPKIALNFGPEWTACMQGELAKAKLKLPYDTAGCARFLPGATPLLKISPALLALKPPVTKPTIKLFGMGPGMAPGPGEPITPAPEGEGMSTTTMLLIAAGVVVVGGGLYYAFGRKKAA